MRNNWLKRCTASDDFGFVNLFARSLVINEHAMASKTTNKAPACARLSRNTKHCQRTDRHDDTRRKADQSNLPDDLAAVIRSQALLNTTGREERRRRAQTRLNLTAMSSSSRDKKASGRQEVYL